MVNVISYVGGEMIIGNRSKNYEKNETDYITYLHKSKKMILALLIEPTYLSLSSFIFLIY